MTAKFAKVDCLCIHTQGAGLVTHGVKSIVLGLISDKAFRIGILHYQNVPRYARPILCPECQFFRHYPLSNDALQLPQLAKLEEMKTTSLGIGEPLGL